MRGRRFRRGRVRRRRCAVPEIVEQIPGLPVLEGDQAPGTYVGETDGSPAASVAFVIQENELVGYVCDGKSFSDWFGGTVDDDRFALESERGTQVEGEVGAEGISGTVVLRGEPEVSYTAAPASSSPPRTGLIVFDDPRGDDVTARWIVTPTAARGVSTTATGRATSGLTITRTSSGTDTRFSGVSSNVSGLQSQVSTLQTQLAASQSESTSLQNTTQQTTTGK